MSRILLTGGAGYIGSHTGVELIQAGHEIVVFDNFCNSHPESLDRMEQITGTTIRRVRGDIRNQTQIETAIRAHDCQAVIHFACLKAVGESGERPLEYYDNNVAGTLSLLRAMRATGVRTLLFSSSATVYGVPQDLPLKETHPLSATNPYARSKLIIEDMLRDIYRAGPEWRIGILRYFNPAGAHASGLIGEDPPGIPNNLMPFMAQVAVGRRNTLRVWGNDYPTPDGTGIRDYLHVVDLAIGHLSALRHLDTPQCLTLNLGTGTGHSVLETLHAFEKISGTTIPHEFAPRRTGDVASCYADPSQALAVLGWKAERTLDHMCEDAWRWQEKNRNGYRS